MPSPESRVDLAQAADALASEVDRLLDHGRVDGDWTDLEGALDNVLSALRASTEGEREAREELDAKGGVGQPAFMKLDHFGREAHEFFGAVAYQVGSSLRTRAWRDVDVRVILSDEEFDAMLGEATRPLALNARWNAACLAWSARGREVTGLPIDFQIQPQSHADEEEGLRNPLGSLSGPWAIHPTDPPRFPAPSPTEQEEARFPYDASESEQAPMTAKPSGEGDASPPDPDTPPCYGRPAPDSPTEQGGTRACESCGETNGHKLDCPTLPGCGCRDDHVSWCPHYNQPAQGSEQEQVRVAKAVKAGEEWALIERLIGLAARCMTQEDVWTCTAAASEIRRLRPQGSEQGQVPARATRAPERGV